MSWSISRIRECVHFANLCAVLIYRAAERPVRKVWIDGKQAVDAGKVVGIDTSEAAAVVDEAQRRAESAVVGLDWAVRSAGQLALLTLEIIGRPTRARPSIE